MDQLKEQSAHEGHCAGHRNSPRFMYRELTEGARFETPDAPETIGPDLTVSVLSQSFTKAKDR